MAKRITGPRWQRIVAQIVARDGGVCHLCGLPGATSCDHVLALADGGTNSPANLRAAHRSCNYAKNGKRSARIRNGDQPPGLGLRRRARTWSGAIDREPGQAPPPPPRRRQPRAPAKHEHPAKVWPGAIPER